MPVKKQNLSSQIGSAAKSANRVPFLGELASIRALEFKYGRHTSAFSCPPLEGVLGSNRFRLNAAAPGQAGFLKDGVNICHVADYFIQSH